jgi:hypothetical protein
MAQKIIIKNSFQGKGLHAWNQDVWQLLMAINNGLIQEDEKHIFIRTSSGNVLTPQIAGHNLKNKLGLIKFGNNDNRKTKIYT